MPTVVPGETAELDQLLQYLEAQRGGLRRSVHNLTDEQAAARPTVSALTLGGLIKHAARCERGWVAIMVGQPEPSRANDWVSEFRMEDGETLAGLLDLYAEVAKATEVAVRGLPSLDVTVSLPEAPWFPKEDRSARWILLHLIEEAARHSGHADILRETLDGATAFELVAAVNG
ncbi:DinB family protein [Solihabitans fulvus]|uniref:DinB family protein n=1 Tax=Solihabitans fulvus TaxID=1892852 RepID=A0A5B2WXN9_9PSEU|nr:DinB family protein [Solihabitans fulvus]KAA2256321.1 DinB family protein [Solihabitans fulvus]